jgi:D-proline reductase (dithiol) PrdB
MTQKETPQITPANRLRELLVQWANDSERGQAVARWIGKTTGTLQFWLMRTSFQTIPWTPLRRPMNEATVALVTTGGIHLHADPPFDLKTDASFRVIPRTATAADLRLTHEKYDRRDATRDVNLVFPLERLLELEAEGIVGRVADLHYGFGFTRNPGKLLAPAREVGRRLAKAQVDLALLVPA